MKFTSDEASKRRYIKILYILQWTFNIYMIVISSLVLMNLYSLDDIGLSILSFANTAALSVFVIMFIAIVKQIQKTLKNIRITKFLNWMIHKFILT